MLNNLKLKYFFIFLISFLLLNIILCSCIYFINDNLDFASATSSYAIYEVDEDDNATYISQLNEYLSEKEISYKNSLKSSLTVLFFVGVISAVLISLLLSEIIYKITNKDLQDDSTYFVTAQQIKELVHREQEENKKLTKDMMKVNEYVNHEFKNMLNQLNGYIYLDEKDNALSYVKEMNETIEDIQILTSDNVEFTTVDLLTICAEVIDTYDNDINFDFSDDLFEIEGNEIIIKRAIHNIVDNAFKYGANNVQIDLSVNEISIVIKISNDSALIDLVEIDKIFNYKYRIDELHSDGRGIGLNIVKNVMDVHKGNIYVDVSSINTFYLAFNK